MTGGRLAGAALSFGTRVASPESRCPAPVGGSATPRSSLAPAKDTWRYEGNENKKKRNRMKEKRAQHWLCCGVQALYPDKDLE